jgi:hypothetical protein
MGSTASMSTVRTVPSSAIRQPVRLGTKKVSVAVTVRQEL